MEVGEEGLSEFFSTITPLLDERQRRVVAGAAARMLGRGGVAAVARVASMSRNTVITGSKEIASGETAPAGRVRREGGGRKRLIDKDPNLLLELDDLVSPEARGDPMSPLRWTSKSTYHLAEVLRAKGFEVSARTVGALLSDLGYSLQGTSKQKEGAQHVDRDAQFRHINDTAVAFMADDQPVISVDTKKKELVGEYSNGGKEYQPKGTPTRTKVHDFIDPEMGKAIPYGVYDVGADEGWVSVGDDADTAGFAVATIGRWWAQMGHARYPHATRLLVCADAGGSNGYRVRAWKVELAKLAKETGLEITVCHYPPGTSKWNRIEHRMFSHITMNWRGRPLVSYRTIVQLIAGTTTKKGLKVKADLDTGHYPLGVKISNKELAAVPITRHEFHGDWNYTIHPEPLK
ncbi:MAG: ISAzo13 family transposase [Actinomycetota bacterium]|nr:ISAzo13 family transposase [Actinomycetota bacterium]